MRLIPWWLLTWATKRFGLCWASVVCIKLYGVREWRDNGWQIKPTAGCFRGRPVGDYCGHYGAEHPCFKTALAQQSALDAAAGEAT